MPLTSSRFRPTGLLYAAAPANTSAAVSSGDDMAFGIDDTRIESHQAVIATSMRRRLSFSGQSLLAIKAAASRQRAGCAAPATSFRFIAATSSRHGPV